MVACAVGRLRVLDGATGIVSTSATTARAGAVDADEGATSANGERSSLPREGDMLIAGA